MNNKVLCSDYLDIEQDITFERIYEINNLFGHKHDGWMKGSCPHKYLHDVELWYPKLYSGGEWVNEITADRLIIYESNVNPVKNKQAMINWLSTTRPVRYVFAKLSAHNFKSRKYYFLGVYTLNHDKSIELQKAVRELTNTRVKIYRIT